MFLNKSSSTNELPSETPITLRDLRCITTRSRLDLCRSAIAIVGFMPATCVHRHTSFTLHLLRTRAFIIRHLRGWDSCGWGRDTRDPTRDKGTPRRSTTDTEIGIWTESLKRVARRKKTGRKSMLSDDEHESRSAPMRRQKTRISPTPRHTYRDAYLNQGGSYTDNLKPIVRRRHEERYTRKNYLRPLLRISV